MNSQSYDRFPLQAFDLCYSYEEESALAVDHVSLAIEKGSFTAVLGHNGSGKSTLAKLLSGLYAATGGKVLACGLDPASEEEPWNIRRRVGMVFQNPDNQIVSNIVREDVAFGPENLGIPRNEMICRIDWALDAVGMSDYAEMAPHMLSGGQKQRVAIAGILAMRPEVMILDEATAMLDPVGRQDVWNVIRKLNREEGTTVLWITHYMEEAAMADRVIVMDGGHLSMDGTPAAVFSHVEEIRALGLDVPPMTELALKLRKAGLPLSEEILTVEDMVKELKKVICPSR